MQVKNKIIVVTGAGDGIGKALAQNLISRGAKVAAIDLRPDVLETLKEELGDDTVRCYPLDISDREAVHKLPEKVIQDFGTVDGVINCAGIIQPFIKVHDLDYDTIERVMNVNFYGTLYMTRAFLPHLLKRPEAHIVNVSSMGGFLAVPGQAVYSGSKAAIKMLTESLYAELLDTPVRVTVVFPGATKTKITDNSKIKLPSGALAQSDKFPMLTAEQVADKVINGMEKNKLQIFTGKDTNVLNLLYRLSPTRATRFIAKRMKFLLE